MLSVVSVDLSLPSFSSHNFSEFVATHLNNAQKEAVFHNNGSIVVIAAAGSGKTRVITSRITYLLTEKKASSSSIVALTFTNKAAQEMRERVIEYTHGSQNNIPFIGTFHSYCLQLLRMHSDALPFQNFTILDEDDKKSLLTKLLKRSVLEKKHTAQSLSHHISRFKNQLPEAQAGLFIQEHPQLFVIMQEYEKEKKQNKCFDFDDLLLEVLHLFKKNPEVKKQHQQRVRHLMVDEYQDTNTIQHALLKEMALDGKGNLAIDSICVVGDEDQSIYSWRGATVDNIIDFKKEFKNTTLIKIEQNYRSKQPILSIANKLICHNSKRNEKKIWSDKKGTDCVRALKCLSSYQEAEIVGRLCKLLYDDPKSSSTAVLYRTHFQSRVIEECLLRHSIPYKIIGGIRFYERKEIKDLLAYLRLLINPFDKVACARIINCPLRGLGDTFQENFFNIWSSEPLLDLHQIIKKISDEKIFSPAKLEELKKFDALFLKHKPHHKTTDVLADIAYQIDYTAYIKKNYEQQEAEERQKNIKELFNAAHFFANQGKSSVAAFLEEVSLLQESIQDEENASIVLMTLHAAKGLEFDNIIITGLEEGILPSMRSLDTQENLEEERRLLYVGITRAKNRILFTHTQYRQSFGQMERQIPSRFLKEISEEFCTFEQADGWQYYEIDAYLSKWVNIAPKKSADVFVFSKPSKLEKPKLATSQKPEKKVFKKSTLAKKTSLTNQETLADDPFEALPKKTVAESHGFKKHQTVQHETFGLGVIQNLEEKSDKTIAHVQFKAGLKKIALSFLKQV